MTITSLVKRLAITWVSVSWFSWFVLDVLKDGHSPRNKLLWAVVAGFFVALSTAPAYYWRFKHEAREKISS